MASRTERAKYLASTLNAISARTNRRFGAGSFDERLILQKTVYLLKQIGYKHGDAYNYGSYLRGPYSSELAKDYYAMEKMSGWSRLPQTSPGERALTTISDAIGRGAGFLEFTTTLHLIARNNPNGTRENWMDRATALKPNLAGHAEEGWEFLRANGLLSVAT